MGCNYSKSSKRDASNPQLANASNPPAGASDFIQRIDANPQAEGQQQGIAASLNRIEESPLKQGPGSRIITQNESPAKILHTAPQNLSCYFFGLDETNIPQIFGYDAKSEEFIRIPAPINLETFNMGAVVYDSTQNIYLTGGVNSDASVITNKVFHYNPQQNIADQLPSFTTPRYAHQVAIFKDHLYVIGGLSYDKIGEDGEGEQENILKSVERYSFATKQWSTVGDLNHGRSLALTLVYRDSLYVIGGYTGQAKRARTVEKFNTQNNTWEIMPFKLPHGLEATYAFSPAADKLQVIGGQALSGATNLNYVYNFIDNTFVPKRTMMHERVLHKGFVQDDKVTIFGGDAGDTIEEYNRTEERWIQQLKDHRVILGSLKSFSFAQPTLHVAHDPSALSEAGAEEVASGTLRTKRCFAFGDDETSFILEINFSKNMVKERSVPANLRLYGYQGAVALPDNTYLLCGGVNMANNYISAKTYVYNPQTNRARKVGRCQNARYTFNLVAMGNHVYAIGGRTWGEDSHAILKSCERYDINTGQWEQIAPLNHARCSAMAFQLKNKVYVLGGYKGEKERWITSEVYNPEKNVWSILKAELKVPLEGSSLVMSNRTGGVFLLGGRTTNGDTDKIWEFDVEQGDMWESGKLKEAKSLNKFYEFQERKVLILGGEKYLIEVFDLTEGKEIENMRIKNEISDNLAVVLGRRKHVDNRFLRFSMA